MPALQILYVEDNDDLRETVGLLLAGDDRVVTSYGRAEEALAAFERGAYDVVITDVSLPTMSGIELARKLLQMAPQTWIVVSSGYDLAHGLQTLGPRVRSLPKPFEIGEMEALMAQIGAELVRERGAG